MAIPRKKIDTTREVVGVFSDADSLQAAIDDLQINGFSEQSISVLANDQTIEKKLGHLYERVEDVEDDPNAPRIAFISKETIGQVEGALVGVPLYVAALTGAGAVVASGGTMLAAMTGTVLAAAAGAGVGGIFARLFSKQYAENIQRQLDRGGLVLWVNVRSDEVENHAKQILKKHAAHNIHAHDLPVP